VAAALEHLERALSIDPEFSLALASQALWTVLAINTGLLPRSDGLESRVVRAAEKAVALDDGASQVLGYAGCALADLGQRERGLEILERALELDPSNAQACVAVGATLALMGNADLGIERMRQGIRMSPRDRRIAFWGWALSHFLFRAGRMEESLVEARAAARHDPRLHLPRIVEAACLANLSRLDEARLALEAARRIRPELTLEQVIRSHGKRVAKELEPIWAP
jgi:tetratricopeptide (TPR) repeat protein